MTANYSSYGSNSGVITPPAEEDTSSPNGEGRRRVTKPHRPVTPRREAHSWRPSQKSPGPQEGPIPHPEVQWITKTLTTENQQSDRGERTPPHSGSMTLCSESREDAAKLKILTPRSATLFGAWNVRTMYTAGKADNIAREMSRYKLHILGISETRWLEAGQVKLNTGELILYSGHQMDGAPHTEGVAIMLSKEAQKALVGWEPLNSRIITAKFLTSKRRIKMNIIQCYAPTSDAEEAVLDEYYEALTAAINKTKKGEVTIMIGDMNAKVGADNEGYEQVMGRHGLGTMNENGERFANFCAENNMIIGGTLFPHKAVHKATWVSPNHITENQIDHVCICKQFRSSLLDVRVRRGADAASDHHLVTAKMRLKLKRNNNPQADRRRYNVLMLQDPTVQTEYKVALANRYQALQETLEENISVEERWKHQKEVWLETCKETVGYRRAENKPWITPGTLAKVETRRTIKTKVNNSRTRTSKQEAHAQYQQANEEVKKSARKDKRSYYERLATEAEEAAGSRNMKALYDTARKLSNRPAKKTRPVKNKEGEVLNTTQQQLERWAEHFKDLLNQIPPEDRADIPPAELPLDINCNPPTKAEIRKAVKQLKNNKAPGPDGIPAEAIKADTETSVNMLHELFTEIWRAEDIPEEWKEGHIIKLPKKGDLSACGNYRGIMLLSAPGKVLNRVILVRIKSAVDKKLRDMQAGFRTERSCADQIATLRIIIEQSLEFNSPLYMNFIDFEKAFDSLDREVLWKLMEHYGIPIKFIRLVQNMYQGMKCKVVHEGYLSDPFEITTGVRQGCLLSPFLFLLAVDWVMKQATTGKRNGIQWTLTEQLDDLDFADDIALLSHSHKQMQEKTNLLYTHAKSTGLRVNIKKTNVMRINTTNTDPVVIDDNRLVDVTSFTYLGSVVDTKGGSDGDIRTRIAKGAAAFGMLGNIWKAKKIATATKLRIFNASVKSVLLYGCETWRTTKALVHKLQTFINKCLRRILGVWWPNKISNIDLWRRCKETPIAEQLKRKKWGWLGHTLRKPATNTTRQALKWNPQGKRRRGRPRNSWRRDLAADMEEAGVNWHELTRTAQNRARWKAAVNGLCSTME